VFTCQCADDDCQALVDLPLGVYDGLRAVDGIVLAPGRVIAARQPEAVDAGELETVREALRGREADSWDRLEDAVSELRELHDAPRDLILGRVTATLDEAAAAATG
jgi:hypothetical protein